jgi:ApbE superfamily uncharacterized protein (UPF0280 family)
VTTALHLPTPSHPRPENARRSSSSSTAARARFADGRWHFQHGPIDLIIGADGETTAVDGAVEQAWSRFQGLLAELVGELRMLRSPVQNAVDVAGPVAWRMVGACFPYRERFITPMAAVAGAVADELIGWFRDDPRVVRAYINNGGDVALHLAAGQSYKIGMYADVGRIKRREAHILDGDFQVTCDMPVRGVATSGWRGRSFSLGIADSVTVLARTAAEADAAATMIANSVNVEDPAILRRPACELKDDTDLGDRLVTVAVGRLTADQVQVALQAGMARARELTHRGLIYGAALWLRGVVCSVGCRPGHWRLRDGNESKS